MRKPTGTSDTDPAPHLARGKQAEDVALQHLQAQGLRLVERNFRCRVGEIDLIMAEENVLVFIEVRYRKSNRYGSALESVDARKQARIIRAANAYLLQRRREVPAARFDVVAIGPGPGTVQLNWVRDAFRP